MKESPQKPRGNGDISPSAERYSLSLTLGALLVETLVEVTQENGGQRDEAAKDQEPGGDGWVKGVGEPERLVVAEEASLHVEPSLRGRFQEHQQS